MIRIKKPKKAPAVLRDQGQTATLQLCQEQDIDPDAFKSWKFNSKVYGAKSVKAALRKAQHDKCAFCESKITHIAYGDVEHFRPKAGYRQRPEDPLEQPGYYWLAYDWTNLLFCCQICNQRHKRNHFPLIDEAERARSHHDDIKKERPLFIHPAEENPHRFLEFNEEYLRAIDGNQRGTVTVDVLGLNRELIAERRREALALLLNMIDCRKLLAIALTKDPDARLANQMAAIDRVLRERASDSGEYAAMVRAIAMKAAIPSV